MANRPLIVVLWCLLALVCVVVSVDRYSSRYDKIDLDAILSNERTLNAIIKCILEKGPCSPEGKELKSKFKLYVSQINKCIKYCYSAQT